MSLDVQLGTPGPAPDRGDRRGVVIPALLAPAAFAAFAQVMSLVTGPDTNAVAHQHGGPVGAD